MFRQSIVSNHIIGNGSTHCYILFRAVEFHAVGSDLAFGAPLPRGDRYFFWESHAFHDRVCTRFRKAKDGRGNIAIATRWKSTKTQST